MYELCVAFKADCAAYKKWESGQGSYEAFVSSGRELANAARNLAHEVLKRAEGGGNT